MTGGGLVVLDTDVASLSIKRRLPPSLLARLVENDMPAAAAGPVPCRTRRDDEWLGSPIRADGSP